VLGCSSPTTPPFPSPPPSDAARGSPRPPCRSRQAQPVAGPASPRVAKPTRWRGGGGDETEYVRAPREIPGMRGRVQAGRAPRAVEFTRRCGGAGGEAMRTDVRRQGRVRAVAVVVGHAGTVARPVAPPVGSLSAWPAVPLSVGSVARLKASRQGTCGRWSRLQPGALQVSRPPGRGYSHGAPRTSCNQGFFYQQLRFYR
jgi:hypothetical protein